MNMTETIDCFTNNCNNDAFELYREDLNMRLFMYEYFITSIDDLQETYHQYCGEWQLDRWFILMFC